MQNPEKVNEVEAGKTNKEPKYCISLPALGSIIKKGKSTDSTGNLKQS
jgi:hypothetical protein